MLPPSLRPVLSVALAVAAAHALHLNDAWWAAISAFTVMQADFRASAWRGLHRIVGTACGAILGVALGPAVSGEPVFFVLLMSLAAAAGLYAALRFRYSYAWVLALVTFSMVACEAFSARAGLEAFAVARAANVGVGTLACVFVAGLAAWRSGPATPASAAAPHTPPTPRDAAWHALQGALAVAVLATLGALHDLQAFAQATVTTMAVLIVPFAPGARNATASVVQRMVQRLAGCGVAGALAFALLPLLDGRPLWCQLALALGVWGGAWFQQHTLRYGYAATQFSVAFLLVFVQDEGWTLDAGPTFHRLVGVFAGIAALSLVLLLFRQRRTSP